MTSPERPMKKIKKKAQALNLGRFFIQHLIRRHLDLFIICGLYRFFFIFVDHEPFLWDPKSKNRGSLVVHSAVKD